MTPLAEFTPYAPRPATLVRKEQLSNYVTLFEFSQDNGRPLAHKPGQFIQVSCYGVGEAPFSISSRPKAGTNTFEIAVRRIGSVTTALHDMEIGAKVGIRGPFGTSFPVQELVGKDTLFVAGGLGYIPLRSLLRYQLKHRDEFGRIIVLVGTRSPVERIFTHELDELAARDDIEVLETVDQGDASWDGNVGVITTLLPKVSLDVENTYVAMVGPPIMYKFVIGACVSDQCISPERIYVSLERKMKCGLGKCGHCQINGINACIDGPVFRFTDIEQLKEAL